MYYRYLSHIKSFILGVPDERQHDLTFTLFAYGFQLADYISIIHQNAVSRQSRTTDRCTLPEHAMQASPATRRGVSRIQASIDSRLSPRPHVVPMEHNWSFSSRGLLISNHMKDHIQPALGGNYRREVRPHEVPRLTAVCYYYFYLSVFVLLGHGFATMVRNITRRLSNCSYK